MFRMSEQNLPITMRDTAFASSTWEDSDDAFSLPDGDLYSLAGAMRRHRVTLDSTTLIVTDADVDDEEFDSAPEEEEEEGDGDDFPDKYDEILNYYDDDGDVPAEVKEPFHEGDNDNSTCHHQHHEVGGDDSAEDESSSSDCSSEEEDEEDDEELNDDQAEEGVEEEEEEEEVSGEEAEEEEENEDSADEAEEEESEDDAEVQADEDGSISEYETDEDSLDACPDPSDDESSCSSVPPHILHGDDGDRRHELFLPVDVSPSTESLKYEEEEDENSEDDDDYSSDEDGVDNNDQDDDRDDVPRYQQRTYIIGQNNRNSGRPRMWGGCPSGTSVSSSSSSGSSRESGSFSSSSSSSKKRKKSEASSGRRGVTFNDSVTVHPVFKPAAYTPSMVTSMYTKRDELRVNKLRNKREFAYEHHDWRSAVEEEEMEANDKGELVHPAHAAEKKKCGGRAPSPRNVVQTYSSALGGYVIGGMSGSAVAHRAKRMRMYYP